MPRDFDEESVVQSPDSHRFIARQGASRAIAFLVVVVWLAGVLVAAAHHEFWRDEVRALSIARAAATPFDLVRLTRNEGHPLLWYVVLYLGSCVTASSVILPVASIAIALGAVALLMLASPLPVWLGALFVFGLPLYEYSVSARNYGISMLLMFTAAFFYRGRATHPLRLAVVLALLANTNAHSTILACLFAALWLTDGVVEKKAELRPPASSLLVLVGGVALASTVAIPHSDSVVSSWIRFEPGRLIEGARSILADPGATFASLVRWVPLPAPVPGAMIWVAILGLAAVRLRFLAAAVAAMLSLGLFFLTVYPGGLRHEALLLVFVLALYWILLDEGAQLTPLRRRLFCAGLFVAIPLLLIGQINVAVTLWNLDVSGQASSSKAFGSFLASSLRYRDAILVPEPDYLVESVPYYAGNRIWLAREHRFGTTASFTSASDRTLSLGQLLADAHRIKSETGRPVLLVLSHPELRGDAHEVVFSYDKVFTWTDEETREMTDALLFVGSFDASYGDENYNVYEIRK